jgi:hypothetical protein
LLLVCLDLGLKFFNLGLWRSLAAYATELCLNRLALLLVFTRVRVGKPPL